MSAPEPHAYLTERIREALAHDPAVAELGISVSVSGGRVLLTGDVATGDRRRAVEQAVAPLVGDLELHNGITVTSASEADGEEVIS
ncbi:MAG: BON domain-containing protein [Acidimicrobiales bacterium]